jgi:Fur family ferric uptake transcriptional regulator
VPIESSLRMTRQRRVILEELAKTDSHPTADELYEMVRKRLPKISLGTVYRNLEAMAELGIIRKLELASAQKRFDHQTENHYHVRCECCGRVADVMAEPSEDLEDVARAATDFEITGYQLEFTGLCPKCRKRKAKGKQDRSGE